MEINITPDVENQVQFQKQRITSFIEGMKEIKFYGPRGNSEDLDTFLLITYDQKTRRDKIDFVTWAKSSEESNSPENLNDPLRSFPSKFIAGLSLIELPKGKNHSPYLRTGLQYYDDIMPSNDGKIIPVIAFGTGPSGRYVLYRRRGLSTKESFERLKKAAGLK